MAQRIDKAAIFIDIQQLFELIYEAQFEAPKRDRIALINRILGHLENMMGYLNHESSSGMLYGESTPYLRRC